ncbi:MAG: PrsW family intramembrane metalloprotease [Acidobacteriaceae bacterium]
MFCVQCGSAIPAEDKFCRSCGAPVYRAAGSAPEVQLASAVPVPQGAVQTAPVYPGVPASIYPGGVPQQPVYYVVQQPAAHTHTLQQMNLLRSLQGRIQSLASTEKLEGFSLKEMFSDVFKKRSAEQVEEYLVVGSEKTTPLIDLVETGWPKPWLFFRVLATMIVAYVICTFMLLHLSDAGNMIPAVMILGSFAFPLATLVLFFELNTPRNVSLHMVAKLFVYGAVVSLGVALLGYTLPIFQLGTWEAGIVEEVAKLLTVVVVMRSTRYKYILNGILFGATVGAGFACFETAGYALNSALLPGLLQGLVQGQTMAVATHSGIVGMLQILRLRGILAPLGHVAWTAIAAGAFWRVKQDKPANVSMFFDSRFLKAFLIPVSMHALWDAPVFMQLPFLGNDIITGLISWYVVFGLVQQGLRQVKDEQRAVLQRTLASVETSMQPAGSVAVP